MCGPAKEPGVAEADRVGPDGPPAEGPISVQRALGHASAAMTLTTYSHLWPDASDRTRKAAEEMLSHALGSTADALRTARSTVGRPLSRGTDPRRLPGPLVSAGVEAGGHVNAGSRFQHRR
jgi:hypothetical protein